MFVVGIKIAAPVMAILILTQVAMGIVARVVPQLNILLMSFPITIGLGLIFIGLSLELFVPYVRGLFDESGKEMINVLIPLMAR
jgi:flagellar biosynthetic protein FliR